MQTTEHQIRLMYVLTDPRQSSQYHNVNGNDCGYQVKKGLPGIFSYFGKNGRLYDKGHYLGHYFDHGNGKHL